MSRPEQLEDRLRTELSRVPVAVEPAADLDAIHHRWRHRRRTRRVVTGAALAVVVVAATALALSWTATEPDHRVDVVDVPPQTGEPQVPLGHVSAQVDTPALEDPAIALSPVGPYSDGQSITVTVPHDFAGDWYYEGAPRLCAVIDDLGGEVCDPTWQPSVEQSHVESTGDTKTVPLRSWIFTPTGWRRCDESGLTCRLVVQAADGTYRASSPLTFTAATGPLRPSLTVEPAPVAEGQDVTLQPSGLTPDPSWLDLRTTDAARAADYDAFSIQVCAMHARTSNCTWAPIAHVIDADHPDAPVRLAVSREPFGYGGWDDCAAVPCYIAVARHVVSGVTPGALSGSDVVAVAAPLRFSDEVAPRPRPSLALVTAPPYRGGQQVTVHVTDLPATSATLTGVGIALCHQDPTRVNDCVYLGWATPTPGEQDVTVTLPTGAGMLSQVPCTGSTCFLGLMPGGEGLGPLATAPIEINSS